jgi:hypothetical protein
MVSLVKVCVVKSYYKTFLLLFLNVSFLTFNSFGQVAPGIEWQNTIGGNDDDLLISIQQTFDKGYILGGFSESNISGDKTENCIGYYDYWIIKTDASGNIQWQNTIGGSFDDRLYSIKQTSDGGYILGGWSDSEISGDKIEGTFGGTTDYWIVKTDSLGNIQWQNTIGGYDFDYLYSIQQTSDGGYILGGSSSSNISSDKTENTNGLEDYWIVKTDSVGNIQWDNTIGGSNDDELYSIQQTSDKGYILGGSSKSNISGDKTENSFSNSNDYWLVKTDSLGNIQWQNTIGGSSDDVLNSIQQTTDGGYILGGTSLSSISGDKTENCIGGNDYWIVKTDSLGNIQWQNTIGGNNGDGISSIQQTIDGGYILGGSSISNISGDKTENCIGAGDYWIVKTDSVGNIQWQNTIGGSNWEQLHSSQQTSDNGYILGGFSESNISGDKTENCIGPYDYWIVKLFPDTTTSISTLQPPTSNLQISPNPSSGIFQITFPSSSSNQKTTYTIEVVNTLGQMVYQTIIKPTDPDMHRDDVRLDVSFLPKGMYVLIINDGVNSFSKKLVIQ